MQAGLLSREITVSGCRRCPDCGRQHRQQRYRERLADPGRSETLRMHGVLMCENRGAPRGALSYRPRSGQRLEEVSLDPMAYP